MRVTPSGESTPLSSSTSSTSSTSSITPQNTLNMLKELLAPNSRYHILYRKDDLIVKTVNNNNSKKQKTDSNIQGCFFLFKDQSEAAKEQNASASVGSSATRSISSFNDAFIFTWVPYTVLASINEKLVTHIKDNGDLATASDYITQESYNNTALNSSVNSNENFKSVQVAASNYYVSAQISPNPNSNAGTSESGSSLLKKSIVSFQASYALTLPFNEIATLKRQIPALGWSYLILMLRNGLSQPPIFFPDGGILDFFTKLQTYILMKKSNEDPNLFVVYGSAPQLHQSLNQIQYDDLFDDIYNAPAGGRDISWQLLEFGSKVTSKAKNFLFGSNNSGSPSKLSKSSTPARVAVKPRGRSKSPSRELQAEGTSSLSDSLSSSVQSDIHIPSITQNVNFNYMSSPSNSMIASAQKEAEAKKPTSDISQPAGDSSGVEEDFEIISELDSKEVPAASVAKIKELIQVSEIDDNAWDREACEKPITAESWKTYLDPEGRVIDPAKLKRDIFYGGIDDAIRGQVWKFLLGYYSFDSTYEERKRHDEEKRKEYEAYKLQWTSITPAQEKRHAGFRERKSRVEKDVVRTDRQHPLFKEDTSPYLTKLYDILVTYSFYNFDLAYCQGMGDLLSPILSVVHDEVEAFWTFASLMEKMETNFQVNSTGMETQLAALAQLVKSMDFELYNYLEEKDALNFFYCFRWVLVIFKREFSFDDIKRLWDSMWSEYLGNQFHLFICYAILHDHKRSIIEKKLCFDEIFKYCVDLSNKMDLNHVLQISEAAYHQYTHQTTKSGYKTLQKPSSSKQ